MRDAGTVCRMNERLRTWGANIKRCRLTLGMTQEQLADLVDVNQSSVQRWEGGLVAPKDDAKIALADALHQDVRMLFPLYRQAKAS